MVRINIGAKLFSGTEVGWVSGGSWEWVPDPIVELTSDHTAVSVRFSNIYHGSRKDEPDIGQWEFTEDVCAVSGSFVLSDPYSVLSLYDPNYGPSCYMEFADITSDIWDDQVLDKKLRIDKAKKFLNTFGPLTIRETFDYAESVQIEGNVFNQAINTLDINLISEGPNSLSIDYETIILESTAISIALRCYQAVESDWDRYHPAIEKFVGGDRYQDFLKGWNDLVGRKSIPECKDWHSLSEIRAYLGLLSIADPSFNQADHLIYNERFQYWEENKTFTELGPLLWFWLYQDILAGSSIRECKGCSRIFRAEPRSRKYCDRFCRGATNSRNTYRRKAHQP